MIRSLYVKSPSIVLTSSTAFWWALQTQTESQPKHTIWVSRHRTLRTQYFYLDVIIWKQYKILASYKDFCKLQSFCLCTPLLTNIVLLFKHRYASLGTFVNLSPLTTCLNSDRRKLSRKYPPGTPSTSQLSKDEQELRWNKLLLDDLNNDLIVTKQNLTKSKTLLVTQVIKIFY